MAQIIASVIACLYLAMSSSAPAQGKLDASDRLSNLLFLALDHGIASIDNGAGPLVPFVIAEASGNRKISRFVADPYERSVAEARSYASTLAPDVTLYAIAYDGYITVEGIKYDAIIVQGAERGKGEAYLIAQRYRLSKSGALEKVANTAYLGREPTLFRHAP